MDLNELKQKLAQCERQQQQLWAYRPLSQELLSNRLGRSLRTTQRYLKALTDKGLIIFRGVAKKGGYYPL